MEGLRPWKSIDNREVPSTYQRVIENSYYIQETIRPVLELLFGTMFSTIDDHDANSTLANADAFYDMIDNRLEVRGVTVNADTPEDNGLPGSYHRNITFELKEPLSIGLQGRSISWEHVLVMTVRIPPNSQLVYPTWQFAFGDRFLQTSYDQNNRALLASNDADDSILYYRKDNGEGMWGAWQPVINMADILPKYKELIANFSQTKIITSAERPAGSALRYDDYWLQPVALRE